MRSITSVPRAPGTGSRRSLLRLVPAAALAAGALLSASHLAHAGGPAPLAVAAAPVASGADPAPAVPLPRKLVGYDPRVTAPDTRHALTASLPVPVADPVGPTGGGPLPTGPVDRAVPGRRHLGPLHTDPTPPGVTLAAPTDTTSLYARSGAVPMTARELAAATTTPPGTPITPGLTEHVTPSCTGSGTDGKRVQALYVHEASTASRYSQVLALLRNEVANVDDVFAVSSRKTGGDLRVRWVHDASCLPVIPDVTVPDGSLAGFDATVNAVTALGFKSADRKYVMFADANDLCGIGTLYDYDSPTNNPNDGAAASYSRVDVNCWSTGESVAAHELTHNLGGVLGNAPHATAYHHCWDEWDLMCYDDGSGTAMRSVCPSGQATLLDCNGDDYFNTAPPAGSFLATHWNTARSSFLEPFPTAPPTVTVEASASSAETGDPVRFTATSGSAVSYAWTSSAAACTLAGATASVATLTCPATVSGPVTATVTVRNASGSATAAATVGLSTAAAPTAALTVPATATAGTGFAVAAAPTGKAPFGYAWSVTGPCALSSATAAAPTVTCASAGDATVSVTVRQADGQTVAAGPAPVTVGAPPGGGTAPASAAWSPVERTRTPPQRLAATLRDAATGAPLAGRPVELQTRPRGSDTWLTSLAGLVTDATGRAVAAPEVTAAGWFRFVLPAGTEYAASSSGSTYLKVPTRLTLTLRRTRHVVLGRLTTLDGTPVGSARLTLLRRHPGSARWAVVARRVTDRHGVVRVRLRARRDGYLRWTYAGEVVHRDATSGRLLLRG